MQTTNDPRPSLRFRRADGIDFRDALEAHRRDVAAWEARQRAAASEPAAVVAAPSEPESWAALARRVYPKLNGRTS